MKGLIVGRYRGYVIEACVAPRATRAEDIATHKFQVSWRVRERNAVLKAIANPSETALHESEAAAIRSVDRSARACIDAMLDGDSLESPGTVARALASHEA